MGDDDGDDDGDGNGDGTIGSGDKGDRRRWVTTTMETVRRCDGATGDGTTGYDDNNNGDR